MIEFKDLRNITSDIYANSVKAVTVVDLVSLRSLSREEGCHQLDRLARELRVAADALKDAAYAYRREGVAR